MLYGVNNPVDGAVLKVILRKADKIRRELGVSVPMPADGNQVLETMMQAVLLHTGGARSAEQMTLALDFGDLERDLEVARESTRASEGRRTVFAQCRLRPEAVLSEWRKAVAVLGGAADVIRFVQTAAERLGAPLAPEQRARQLQRELAGLDRLQDAFAAIARQCGPRICLPITAGCGPPGPAGAKPWVGAMASGRCYQWT